MPDGIFVTGTDTGVGKTFVCALLMISFEDTCYWKPIQTGSAEGTDREWIRRVTGLPDYRFIPEVYCFKDPVSPHLASMQEKRRIDLSNIRLPALPSRKLVVEGAGGVMVPINEDKFMLDLMLYLGFPVLVVARSTLGTINHTLLTISALRNSGVEVLGVILNGPRNKHNREAIEYYGNVRVIGEIEPVPRVTVNVLRGLRKEMSLL